MFSFGRKFHDYCILAETLYFQLELTLNKEDGGDISSFVSNGEWDLIGEFWFDWLDWLIGEFWLIGDFWLETSTKVIKFCQI